MSKKIFVNKIRTDVSKDGKPIPIYRLSSVDNVQMKKDLTKKSSEIKRVSL